MRTKAFSRRYGASAIDFGHKYRFDPFFRTEVMIIGLQIVFAIFIITLIALGFSELYREITMNLIASILASVRAKVPVSAQLITSNLEYLKSQNLVIIGALILIGTSVFAYLVTRLALMPARNALAAQKQFIGNIAHELRTPLSIIKTNAEVALFSDTIDTPTRTMLESTVEELDRISNIINNLLSLSTFIRPEQVHFSNTDLGAVVYKAVGHLGDLARQKRIAVQVTAGDYHTVWGNATALEQIVMNVLKNSLHYTKTGGGAVKISIQPDFAGAIELVIEDRGIGIPERDLYRIFEPFYRGDYSRTRSQGGSGLGLAIVNELLKLHQGRMTIRSAPKHGTKVSILLPAGKTERPSDERVYEEVAVDFSQHKPGS